MKQIHLFLLLLIGTLSTNAQISVTNSTAGTLTGGSGHLDKTFIFTSGNVGSCTSLSKVTLNLQLSIGTGTPCSGGGYGVHEDLNVRLVSPQGTTVDLVQDRWGYWTGNSSQSHSFNGFSVVDAAINFDDDHTSNIMTLDQWTAGNFAPHNPLSAFNGENPVGTWTLRISDGNVQFSVNDFYCFITGTLTICGSALPVELTKFTLQETLNNEIQINWETATEINNDFFTIQRSKNGFDWQNVTEIKGAENSSEIKKYDAIDRYPHLGVSYYRIKQTDYNGNYEYSDIKSIKILNQSNSIISTYPNPTYSKVHVIGGGLLTKEEIQVFNMYGQKINFNLKINENSANSFLIDFTNLNSGIYLIKTKTTTNKVYVIQAP